MDEGDTKGTFGKPPRNWNGISRFVKVSNGTKESLTGDTVALDSPLYFLFPAATTTPSRGKQ